MADARTGGEVQIVHDRGRWAVVPRVHDGLEGAYARDLAIGEATAALRQAQAEVPELEWVLVTHEEATRRKPAPGEESGADARGSP